METAKEGLQDTERKSSWNKILVQIRAFVMCGSSSHTQQPDRPNRSTEVNRSSLETKPLTNPMGDHHHNAVEVPSGFIEAADSDDSDVQPAMKGETDVFPTDSRAAALFEKHNVESRAPLRAAQVRSTAERVEKSVRIRIRFTCHRCNTSFGHEKECTSCRHKRCGRCDRYPPRKNRERRVGTPIDPVTVATLENEPTTAIEAASCTCHECQTDVVIGLEQCPNCSHTICERCLQESENSIDSRQRTVDKVPVPPTSEDSIARAPPEFLVNAKPSR